MRARKDVDGGRSPGLADAPAMTAGRRVPLFSLMALALVVVVGLVLGGWGQGPSVPRPAGLQGGGDTDIRWEPATVEGLQGCRGLARLSSPGSPDPSDGLESLRLPCLTRGPDVDLAQLRGRLVLVNLWASWCAPCRKEMPVLTAAAEQFGDRVQFVGVDTADAPDPAGHFLEEFGVTYPQLADPNAVLLKHLRIPGIPVTLILGPDGTVVDKHIGPFEGDELTQLLEDVVAENG